MCENNNYEYNITARIIYHRLRFYRYAVTCADSYIQHDNPKRLQNFMQNLCKMNRGQVALDDYFQPLLAACTSSNIEEITNIRNQLLKDIQKNELILEYTLSRQS